MDGAKCTKARVKDVKTSIVPKLYNKSCVHLFFKINVFQC